MASGEGKMNLTGRKPYRKETGDDSAYLAWIRTQPSCVSGLFSEYVNGKGMSVAAHVRRKSGVAVKPKFSAVPLTDEEHRLQHQYGEHGLLNRKLPGVWDRQTAKRWFEIKAKEHLARWKETV